MRVIKSTCWAALIIALSIVSVAPAQSTFATITGTVTDPNGAIVNGATIEVTNNRTSYVYSVTSNDEGVYTVANLLDGVYTLKVRARGFSEFTINELVLNVRENRRLDVRLKVEAVTNTVEITAGGATLKASFAATSTNQSPTRDHTAKSRAHSRTILASLTAITDRGISITAFPSRSNVV